MPTEKSGLIVINLGTPLSPSIGDVRNYLREFLMDPFVIDIPWLARFLLVQGVIAPFRAPKSAHAYQSIWTEKGSPLLVFTRELFEAMPKKFDVQCLAMRYGEPSIASAVQELVAAQVTSITVLPLFPQFSLAATESPIEKVRQELLKLGSSIPVKALKFFYQDEKYQKILAEHVTSELAGFSADHYLVSFHGLPERQLAKTDAGCAMVCGKTPNCCEVAELENKNCYRHQCIESAKRLATDVAWPSDRWSYAFQSRLGRTKWIGPYTDQVLDQLRDAGVETIAMVCPSFIVDCLETLEEIGQRAKDRWKERGGKDFRLVSSLNANPQLAVELIRMAQEL